MAYNLTNITSATSLGDTLIETGKVVNGMYGISFIIIIFSVVFLTLKSRGYFNKDCFAVAAYIGGICSFLLFSINFIPFKLFLAAITLMGVGVALVYLERDVP